jgi:hypothetical protein
VKSFTKGKLFVLCEPSKGDPPLVLSNLSIALWDWALNRNIFLSAEDLWQSRYFNDSSNLQLYVSKGVSRSDADSRAMCQIPFCGQTECPVASVFQLEVRSKSDCLRYPSTGWSHEKSYAFPPFCLIMRSLAKLRAQGAELILATHLWPTQASYPNLLDLSVSLPVYFPMNPSLLLGPRGEIYPLIANQTLQLHWKKSEIHTTKFAIAPLNP